MTNATNNDSANTSVAATITPKWVFVFSTYQLQLLAAVHAGCGTAVEIRAMLQETNTTGGPIRRRSYDAIATLKKCGVLDSEKTGSCSGRTRHVAIRPEALPLVRKHLRAAGLLIDDATDGELNVAA